MEHRGVLERLDHRQVGVAQPDVLADERDPDATVEMLDAVAQVLPRRQVEAMRLEPEATDHELVEALLAQTDRDEVDVGRVLRDDHGALVEVGEQGDLRAQLVGERARRAADDDVGRDTDAPQLVDRVLRRLGLQLARGLDHRDERDVHVEHVVATELVAQLADRLEEREALDVADRAADLGQHDVDVGRLRDAQDACLDLVGDVRDHLHRLAEVVALALLADDGVVDAAGGVVRGARRVLVDEALVVPEVEVGLGPVLGDEHLAVLVGRHRARVDVDVRVELLHAHLEPVRLQQGPERGGGDALAERRDDAPGDEHVLGLPVHRGAPRLDTRPASGWIRDPAGAGGAAPRRSSQNADRISSSPEEKQAPRPGSRSRPPDAFDPSLRC